MTFTIALPKGRPGEDAEPFIVLRGQTREAWLTAGEPFVHPSLTHTAISEAAVVVIEGR